MTSEQKKQFSKKYDPEEKPDELIAAAVRKAAHTGRLSCKEAFRISRESGRTPAEVGKTLDLLDCRLTECQLGLFGYLPRKKVVNPVQPGSPDLAEAIRKRLVNGRLSCREAWDIADLFAVPKMAVSGTCEALGIKVAPCQLGAF